MPFIKEDPHHFNFPDMIYLKKAFVLIFINALAYSAAAQYSIPSPSAAQSTKYGNSSLNESTGKITASIPLHNYQAGNLSVPLGLQYIGNGVKIDQHSNWVGTNWFLNAGGVITRIVNHIPDEHAEDRLFAEDAAYLTDPANGMYSKQLIDGENATDDLRPDVFSFSFPGYSGNFYLDENNIPRLMHASSELKIEITSTGAATTPPTLNTIILTTPTGIKYFFGGQDAAESSTTLVTITPAPKGSFGNNVDFNVLPKAITAFYLFKIEHPYGDEIFLEYVDDGEMEYLMFQGDQITQMEESYSSDLSDYCSQNIDTYTKVHKRYKGKVFNRKKISRIYSPQSANEVRFNSTYLVLDPVTTFNNYGNPQYDDRILNSIHLYNSQLEEIQRQINLEYITTPHRIFLQQVSLNNSTDPLSNSKCSVYRMEYDQPELLPERFSRSQDILGYYNGAGNSTFLPQTEDFEFEGIFSTLADRNINFNNTKKGSLLKIHYPTGGFTSFEYEAPKVKALLKQRVHLEAYLDQTNRIPQTLLSDSGNFGQPYNLIDSPVQNLPVDQNIKVDATIKVESGYVTQNDKIYFDLHNVTTSQTVTQFRSLEHYTENYNWNLNFNLQEGNAYTLTMRLSSNIQASLIAQAFVDYLDYKEFNAYGIRIKRILENSGNNIPLTKRYYYKRAEKALLTGEDPESAKVTYSPTNVYRQNHISSCCSTSSGSYVHSYVSLVSNPFSYFFASADDQVIYKYVTVSLGGDLFQQGGIQKEYLIDELQEPEIIHTPLPDMDPKDIFLGNLADNNTIFNGVLLKETHLKKMSSALYKVKDISYEYDRQILDATDGLILAVNTNFCVTPTMEIYDPYLATYNNFSYGFDLINILTKDYFGALPPVITPTPIKGIPLPEETFISSQQNIRYGNLKGLPVSITTTNSDGDQQIVKNFYTPADIIGGNFSSAELDAFNARFNQNQIASPIQVERFMTENGGPETLMSRERVTYHIFNGLPLLKKIENSKKNNPFNSIISYLKYDIEGYPLEFSSENEIKTSFLYGYKDKQLLAEMKNLSYDDIPSSTVDSIKVLADSVVDEASMIPLEQALDQLREDFPGARITTYLYNERGQLSSMKDIRGTKVSYEYDECQRVIRVMDNEGNIIQETNYNVVVNNN